VIRLAGQLDSGKRKCRNLEKIGEEYKRGVCSVTGQ
jgi:hypothetical protein